MYIIFIFEIYIFCLVLHLCMWPGICSKSCCHSNDSFLWCRWNV